MLSLSRRGCECAGVPGSMSASWWGCACLSLYSGSCGAAEAQYLHGYLRQCYIIETFKSQRFGLRCVLQRSTWLMSVPHTGAEDGHQPYAIRPYEVCSITHCQQWKDPHHPAIGVPCHPAAAFCLLQMSTSEGQSGGNIRSSCLIVDRWRAAKAKPEKRLQGEGRLQAKGRL